MNNKKILILPIIIITLTVVLFTGCTSQNQSGNNGGNNNSSASGTTISLSAKNIAFNLSTITVPAGAQITINFNNEDSGIPHNFAVYETSSASNSIFVGDIITGVSSTTYTFTSPITPGTYWFRCDVHPQQMNGDFIIQ